MTTLTSTTQSVREIKPAVEGDSCEAEWLLFSSTEDSGSQVSEFMLP